MSAGAAPAPGVRCHGTDRSVALPQSRQAAASAQAERVPGWAPSRGTDCVWPLCRRAARPPSARPPHARCHPCGAALSQIADVLTEHESCSKQHAVLQFRRVTVAPKKKTLDATVKRVVKCVCCRAHLVRSAPAAPHALCARLHRPYLMDLQSANGTFVNGKRIEDSRSVPALHAWCRLRRRC